MNLHLAYDRNANPTGLRARSKGDISTTHLQTGIASPLSAGRLNMGSVRADLARQVLILLAHGQSVPTGDALQLRNWAVLPQDAMLSLKEIALNILDHPENQHAKAAEQR
jgi:hypothetical protein